MPGAAATTYGIEFTQCAAVATMPGLRSRPASMELGCQPWITANVSGVSFTATMDAHDLADCGRGDQVQRAAAEITFGFTIDALQRRLSSPAN